MLFKDLHLFFKRELLAGASDLNGHLLTQSSTSLTYSDSTFCICTYSFLVLITGIVFICVHAEARQPVCRISNQNHAHTRKNQTAAQKVEGRYLAAVMLQRKSAKKKWSCGLFAGEIGERCK